MHAVSQHCGSPGSQNTGHHGRRVSQTSVKCGKQGKGQNMAHTLPGETAREAGQSLAQTTWSSASPLSLRCFRVQMGAHRSSPRDHMSALRFCPHFCHDSAPLPDTLINGMELKTHFKAHILIDTQSEQKGQQYTLVLVKLNHYVKKNESTSSSLAYQTKMN